MSGNGRNGKNGNGRSNGNGRTTNTPKGIAWDRDPEIPRTICRALKAGSGIGEAARAAGIGHRTLNQWRKDHAKVADAVTRARARGRARRLRIVQYHARKDWRAAAWMLERENPKRYSQKHIIDAKLTHAGAVEITESDLMKEILSDDGLRSSLDSAQARAGGRMGDPGGNGSEGEPG